jgi:hypothetical protein
MEKDLRNNVKFILFCTECLQAGVVMTPKEYEVAFMAAEKFEGFDDKSFENMKPERFAPRMNAMLQAMLQAMSKRKQIIEGLTFNLLTKKSLGELIESNLVEEVMKAKNIAAAMADELLEPDEKLEKVVTDGRRVIEHFIDQWKKAPIEEEKKEYEPESDAEIVE